MQNSKDPDAYLDQGDDVTGASNERTIIFWIGMLVLGVLSCLFDVAVLLVVLWLLGVLK